MTDSVRLVIRLAIESECKLRGTVAYYDMLSEILKTKRSIESKKIIIECLDYIEELEKNGYKYHV